MQPLKICIVLRFKCCRGRLFLESSRVQPTWARRLQRDAYFRRRKCFRTSQFCCFTVLGRDMTVCGESHFEELCTAESRRVSVSQKKTSSREDRLGLNEKCTGCCYDTFFDKRCKKGLVEVRLCCKL